MDNARGRKVVNELERMIEVCVWDEQDATWWRNAVKHYRFAMNRLRSKYDLSDEEIFLFQKDCDIFFQDWVKIYGREGLTNYIHMLGSGHMAEYLFEWRNMYQHSQQGWEAFNALLKNYYFKWTTRGGGRGDKSKLRPIGKWLQQRLMFMIGVTLADMEAALDHNTIT
jgi:hypothetical protein